jgi:hypothetical protein
MNSSGTSLNSSNALNRALCYSYRVSICLTGLTRRCCKRIIHFQLSCIHILIRATNKDTNVSYPPIEHIRFHWNTIAQLIKPPYSSLHIPSPLKPLPGTRRSSTFFNVRGPIHPRRRADETHPHLHLYAKRMEYSYCMPCAIRARR